MNDTDPILHSFVGKDGTRFDTLFVHTKKEAQAFEVQAKEQGADFVKTFRGGCIAKYRVAAHFPSLGR